MQEHKAKLSSFRNVIMRRDDFYDELLWLYAVIMQKCILHPWLSSVESNFLGPHMFSSARIFLRLRDVCELYTRDLLNSC